MPEIYTPFFKDFNLLFHSCLKCEMHKKPDGQFIFVFLFLFIILEYCSDMFCLFKRILGSAYLTYIRRVLTFRWLRVECGNLIVSNWRQRSFNTHCFLCLRITFFLMSIKSAVCLCVFKSKRIGAATWQQKKYFVLMGIWWVCVYSDFNNIPPGGHRDFSVRVLMKIIFHACINKQFNIVTHRI